MNGASTTFAYNAANQLTSGPTTPSHDGNGNETTGPDGRTLVYNAKHQTTSITPPGGAALTMAYADADQTERVSAGATSFTSGLLGLGIATTAGSSNFYTRDDDGNLVVQITPSGARNYYLFDGLGSVVGLADAAGNLSASYDYDPYGQALSTTGTAAAANPFRFVSGYLDSETGLTKFGTRYYDPSRGRWTQQDLVVGSIGDPGTVNRYVYVASEPVNFVDPDGRCLIAAYESGACIGGSIKKLRFKNFQQAIGYLQTAYLQLSLGPL